MSAKREGHKEEGANTGENYTRQKVSKKKKKRIQGKGCGQNGKDTRRIEVFTNEARNQERWW